MASVNLLIPDEYLKYYQNIGKSYNAVIDKYTLQQIYSGQACYEISLHFRTNKEAMKAAHNFKRRKTVVHVEVDLDRINLK